MLPFALVFVVLVQSASAELNHFAGTPFMLVVAAINVRAPLTCCVLHDVMLPSILTQLLRIGIAVGGIEIIVFGVEETAAGSGLAKAPAKLRPSTAIAVIRTVAIMVFFLVIIFIFIISGFLIPSYSGAK